MVAGPRRHFVILAIAACAISSICAGDAWAEERRVAVVPSLRVNVLSARADVLAKALGGVLAEIYLVNVVAGQDNGVPADLPETCIAEPDCVRQLGQKLDVDEILFIAFVALSEDEVQVEVTAFDVRSGSAVSRPMVAVDPKDPENAFREHAAELLPDAKKRPPPPPKPPEKKIVVPIKIEQPAPQPRGRHIDRATLVTGSLTLAALAGAGTFALLSNREYSALEESCPDACNKDTLGLYNTVADGLFVMSLVGAGLTSYFYLTSADEESSPVVFGGSSEHVSVAFVRAF